MTPAVLGLMYHRVLEPYLPEAHFSHHLKSLAQRFPIVLPEPGVRLKPFSLALTFDDAYFDFYHLVFPLLKALNLKVLLAVPTNFILADTDLPAQVRLSVPYPQEMHGDCYQHKAPFCTWAELKEMADSKVVEMASHSCSHSNLSDPCVDVQHEVVRSKEILQEKLQHPIHHFVYPYGKWTPKVHQLVCQHYQWAWRIGSAINYGLESPMLYRVNGDLFWKEAHPFNKLGAFKFKYWLNRLRKK